MINSVYEVHIDCGCGKHNDGLEKSKQVRDRFQRAGHLDKDTNYKFIDEQIQAISRYVKMAHIALVNHIVDGMASNKAQKAEVQKSIFTVNADSLINEDDSLLLTKGFLDKIKKISRRLRAKFSRVPAPDKEVKVLYDPEENVTPKEFNHIDDIIWHYLRDHVNDKVIESVQAAAQSGVLAGEIESQGTKPKQVASMDYDSLIEEAEKIKSETGLSNDMAYAAQWAKDHAAEWIAVYDENGERSGAEYERISRLFRDHIQYSIENGESLGQLKSRLIFPVKWDDVKRHQEDLSESLSPEELRLYSVAHLNRDFERLAFTEMQFAVNNGRLVRWSRLGSVKVSFNSMGSNKNPCDFCLEHRGAVLMLFNSESDMMAHPAYTGGDKGDELNPELADGAMYGVWAGKNNVGRSQSDWWLCAPAHPHCVDTYFFEG